MRGELVESRSAIDPDRFRTVIRDGICTMQFHTDVKALAKTASLAGIQAGAINVLRYTGEGVQWGDRNRDDIRADRADYYVVCAPISAELTVSQNGANACLHPGTFAIVSTCRPFKALIRSLAADHSFSALHVRVPGSLLRPRIPNVDDICSRQLEIHPGAGRMMLSLFDIALNDVPYLSEDERSQFGAVLLNAISNVALPMCEGAAQKKDRQPAHRSILNKAKAYIAAHLSNAELSPAQIAEHCGVSVRYLHAVFSKLSSDTVTSFIRESRLQGCRAALQSPLLRQSTIIQIAGDWGFDDPSHLCHIYKSRFGKTPREERYREPRALRQMADAI